jgi:predicted porin
MTRATRAGLIAWATAGFSGLFAAPAWANQDVEVLRREIQELKQQLNELRAVVKGSGHANGAEPAVAAPAQPLPAARPAPPTVAATPPAASSGRSVTVGGIELSIYGTLNADAGTVARTGATASVAALNSLVGPTGLAPTDVPSRYTLRSNSSNLGFRGRRDGLPFGLAAVFQLESALGLDGNSSTLLGRDTYVGLAHAYGTLLYGGNIDSPYKRGVQGKDPFYATGVATQKGILGSPGFNVTSVNATSGNTIGNNAANAQQQNAGFDARLNNLVMYHTPKLAGLSAELGYGLNENRATSVGSQIEPRVLSTLLRYESGPWFASYAYEWRRDVFGLNSLLTFVPATGVTGAPFTVAQGARSTDRADKLGIGYNFGATELLGVWERLQYQTNVGPVRRYERDAWVASIAHRIARHRLIASLGVADAGRCALASGTACATRGLGARQIGLGYDYSLDRDTVLYAFWSRIVNDEAAAYNFGVSGAPAAGVGADPQALALGIRYRF